MKLVSLAYAVLAISGLSTSALASERTACSPIVGISCQAWPHQAQMVGEVVAVQAFSVEDQSLCKVTVEPRIWNMHALCAMHLTQSTFSYDVCGACPEVGSETSGVVLSNKSGLTILD